MEHHFISLDPVRAIDAHAEALAVYELTGPDPDLPSAEEPFSPPPPRRERAFVVPRTPVNLLAIPEDIIDSLTEALGR